MVKTNIPQHFYSFKLQGCLLFSLLFADKYFGEGKIRINECFGFTLSTLQFFYVSILMIEIATFIVTIPNHRMNITTQVVTPISYHKMH